MNRGCTSKTDTSAGDSGAIGRGQRLRAGARGAAIHPRQDPHAKVTEPQIRVVDPAERAVKALAAGRSLERRAVVRLVAEPQYAPVPVGQIAEECRIEEQRVVAIG